MPTEKQWAKFYMVKNKIDDLIKKIKQDLCSEDGGFLTFFIKPKGDAGPSFPERHYVYEDDENGTLRSHAKQLEKYGFIGDKIYESNIPKFKFSLGIDS